MAVGPRLNLLVVHARRARGVTGIVCSGQLSVEVDEAGHVGRIVDDLAEVSAVDDIGQLDGRDRAARTSRDDSAGG
jgi:hypothetical protein